MLTGINAMKRVLFLCTHNACHSQIAEALVNHFLGDRFKAFSAGTEATQLNPLTTRVMAEIGIDISGHRSKCLDEFSGQSFDYVITLCDDANEKCPLFLGGVERIHMGVEDPSLRFGSEAEIITEFRRVRDDLKSRLINFFEVEFTKQSL
jgi:arsenate reductase